MNVESLNKIHEIGTTKDITNSRTKPESEWQIFHIHPHLSLSYQIDKYSGPPLSEMHMFQDHQWIPETMDSNLSYIYYIFCL